MAETVDMSNIAPPLTWDATDERQTRPLGAFAVLAYLVLAIVLCVAMVIVAPLGLWTSLLAHVPMSLHGILFVGIPLVAPAVAFAVAAYLAERASRLSKLVLARKAPLAVYAPAALLFPAPWPVLIAAVSVVACYLTLAGGSSKARLAATAHTLVVVALFTVLAHVMLGDASLLHGLVTLVTQPGNPVPASPVPPLAGLAGTSPDVPAAYVPAGLALGLYLIDTVPLTLMAAASRRTELAYAWRTYFAHDLFCDAAVPGLAILVAVTYAAVRPAAFLLVLFMLALVWGLEHAAALRGRASALSEAHVRMASMSEHVSATVERTAQVQSTLDSVLMAVRAVGRSDDLTMVTRNLAHHAVLLTTAPSCTVYLYEPNKGVFAPYVSSDGDVQPDRDKVMPRAAAELMLSAQHSLGHSYFIHVGRPIEGSVDRWREGDLLLVPLPTRNGDVIGFVSLHAPPDGQVPQPAELELVEAVAHVAAGMVARLHLTAPALPSATADELTGLLNRRALEERLRRELERVSSDRPVALMMIDLDDFAAVNNSHGRQIGDEMLRLVAGVIRSRLRQTDAGGRYGGDEFMVIMPGLDAMGALDVAERLRAVLVEVTTRVAAKGKLPNIYVSIGVVSSPEDATGADGLIKIAEDAVYTAKRHGKNAVSRPSVG